MMGCLKLVVYMVLLAAAALFAFLNRDRIAAKWHELRGTEVVATTPSQAIADAADLKLRDLRDGKRHQVSLTEVELQSLLQFKYRELLPAFIDSPRVELDDNKIVLRGRVPLDRLPRLSELGEAAAFLPDTTEIGITGQLLPLSDGRIALTVDQVRAARIPLPQRLVAGALRKLGRKDEPGLPADALAVPLPPGADVAYVRGDSLVFLKSTRN